MWTLSSEQFCLLALGASLLSVGCESSFSSMPTDTEQSAEGLVIRSTEGDWREVEERIKEAYAQELNELPMGDLVAKIGLTFLGTPYAPQTLDPRGEEELVVELEELDCVTFVETVLALAGVVHGLEFDSYSRMSNEEIRGAYAKELEALRYRSGHLNGYASRLHYFSDWVKDNAALGLVDEVFTTYPAILDNEPVNFMTSHPEAYWQLREDEELLVEIKKTEIALSKRERFYVPQQSLYQIEPELRPGDIVAATSSVEGLDVAHTGLAIRKDDRIHLLHAPLVGGVVQISEQPLTERILDKMAQDGVIVARPLG